MTDADQHASSELFPEWKPTEWTPWQRQAAIGALLLLGGGCALIAGAFAIWGDGPLAWDTFIPIGMSLYCLGGILLPYVYWYSNKHARNSTGSHANITRTAYGMLIVSALLTLSNLALQVVGGILVATVGWEWWRSYSGTSYVLTTAICALLGFGLTVGSAQLPWHSTRDTRDSASPTSALGAPVTGVRLVLRWGVMLIAGATWLLIGGPLIILYSLLGSLTLVGQAGTAIVAQPAPLFAIAAVLFLTTALIECIPSRRVVASQH